MRSRAFVLSLATVATMASPLIRRIDAQSTVDFIRGTILGPDKKPIESVLVTATSILLNVNRPTRTGKDGTFSITFPDGGGDYWISLAAVGYTGKRFELRRNADEDVLVVNETLQIGLLTLHPVKVAADRKKPVRNDTSSDVSGTQTTIDMSSLALDQLGDLTAMTAMLPGVTLIAGADGSPSAFTVLGLDPSENSYLFNGINAGSASVPMDAPLSVSVVTSPFDVSQGRFGGAGVSAHLGAGSNVIRRTGIVTGDAPPLQLTDAVGKADGSQFSQGRASGSFSGPITLDRVFYSLSYEVDHRFSDLHTLGNASTAALQANGVSRDSVTRLLAVMAAEDIPQSLAAIPAVNVTNSGALTGTFDFNPRSPTSSQSFNLFFLGNWSNTAPGAGALTGFPTRGAQSSRWSGTLGGRHTDYFGFLASETNVGVTETRSFSDPYLALPSGTVRVVSTFPGAAPAVATLAFGGGASYASATTSTVTATNLLRWFSSDNTHLIKLTTELYHDAASSNAFPNAYGSFVFDSLADVQAGTPASFTRSLAPRIQAVGQSAFGESLGDSWQPEPRLHIVYGVRVDGNRLDSRPAYDPAVEHAFGLRNDDVPSKLYPSARAGFSWTYGTAPISSSGMMAMSSGSAHIPRAVVQGGVGYFQNMSWAGPLLNAVISSTGLPASAQQLTCVGADVPTPDWSAYIDDVGAIPTQCANGAANAAFASSVPNVAVYDPSYLQPRSLRATLGWSGFFNAFLRGAVNATYSRNQRQPSWVDLNFDPVVRFTLPDEGDRPVYASPASIVSSTGVIAPGAASLSPLFNHVQELRSDGLSEARQVTVSLAPVRYSGVFSWRLTYTYHSIEDRENGFTGSTAGNPLLEDWGPASGAGDWHHQLQVSASYNWGNVITVQPQVSLNSPTAFTPTVGGDILGDGYANDRAFVFDPAHAADPTVAAGMQSLLTSASRGIQECVRGQLGQIAARNSCQGPWTVGYSSLSFRANPQRFRLSQRTNVQLSVANPAAGVDLLLHGPNHLAGWGEAPPPQQTLLYVRGFDQSTDQFLYTVNPRFGSTSLSQASFRRPTQLTLSFTYNIGPSRERQSLLRLLDEGRTLPGTKATAATIHTAVVVGIFDPLAAIVRSSDSLGLTSAQADSVSTLDRIFITRQDSLWAPIIGELAALPDTYQDDAAYARYVVGREAVIDLLLELSPKVEGILTPAQRRRLPAAAAQWLDPHFLKLIRSSTVTPP